MGSRARDFNGNEVYDVEQMSASEDKVQELDTLIDKCENEMSMLRDEANEWEDIRDELTMMREKVTTELDVESDDEEEDDGLHYNSHWGLHRLSDDTPDDGS